MSCISLSTILQSKVSTYALLFPTSSLQLTKYTHDRDAKLELNMDLPSYLRNRGSVRGSANPFSVFQPDVDNALASSKRRKYIALAQGSEEDTPIVRTDSQVCT